MNERLFNILNPIRCRNRRVRIIINQIVVPLLLLLIFWSYHLLLFGESFETKNLKVYSNQKARTTELQQTIDSVLKVLEFNHIEIRGSVRIFIASDEKEYNKATFYLKKQTKGVTYPMVNRIVISTIYGKYRTLKGLILHELIHIYQNQQFGLISSYRLPEWKAEGLCDYIAASSSISVTEGRQIFENIQQEKAVLNLNNVKTQEYKYYKYRMYYDYLIHQKSLTIDEIIKSEIDIDELEKEMRIKYKNFST